MHRAGDRVCAVEDESCEQGDPAAANPPAGSVDAVEGLVGGGSPSGDIGEEAGEGGDGIERLALAVGGAFAAQQLLGDDEVPLADEDDPTRRAAFVTVIDAADFRDGATSVPELLQKSVGVSIRRFGGPEGGEGRPPRRIRRL